MELDAKHQTLRELAVTYWRMRLGGAKAGSDEAIKVSNLMDELAKDCAECCDQCSAIFCPYDEPLHGHHDGCPCCDMEPVPPAGEYLDWQRNRWRILIGKNTMSPMQPEHIEVKEVEGARLKAGESFVVIPPFDFTQDQYEKLNDHCVKHGLVILVLPAGTKLYIAGGS